MHGCLQTEFGGILKTLQESHLAKRSERAHLFVAGVASTGLHIQLKTSSPSKRDFSRIAFGSSLDIGGSSESFTPDQ
jgi:hypothetical protein